MDRPIHENYMQRCIELALKGVGDVAPNPMVGAVLVHESTIIGEGYHEFYGGPHAEVNCFRSVDLINEHKIRYSTLYVSLEPCAHFGKTPPCADLIIEKGVQKVVIGIRDPFQAVNGKGIEKLQKAGVCVITDILKEECYELNKRFFTFHQKKRPYIILKWAQTADGHIGNSSNDRLLITNERTNKLVHQWRSQEAAILVGTNTVLKDDPQLNVRSWKGSSPVRIIIDNDLRIPSDKKVLADGNRTIVINEHQQEKVGNIEYIRSDGNVIDALIRYCHEHHLISVLVEGGAGTLRSFIENDLWDEVRVITNTTMQAGDLSAPAIPVGQIIERTMSGDDEILIIRNRTASE